MGDAPPVGTPWPGVPCRCHAPLFPVAHRPSPFLPSASGSPGYWPQSSAARRKTERRAIRTHEDSPVRAGTLLMSCLRLRPADPSGGSRKPRRGGSSDRKSPEIAPDRLARPPRAPVPLVFPESPTLLPLRVTGEDGEKLRGKMVQVGSFLPAKSFGSGIRR